jgi:N-dimethylarginine dimethylaminohydrolase
MIHDATRRAATPRSYLMCPPEHFAVSYAINPWMRPDEPADAGAAMAQWERLRQVYLYLGHSVSVIDPVPGLPDMVFAANGATVVDGTVLGVRFRHPERAAEARAYLDWFRMRGWPSVHVPEFVNEGEGDILVAGAVFPQPTSPDRPPGFPQPTSPDRPPGFPQPTNPGRPPVLIAGYGFRSDVEASGELARVFGRPVVSVRLVDPRFYHLDTALCVLDSSTAMYYPAAFDDAGRAALASVFGELIEAKDEDAEVLGLNAVSDGYHVVLAAEATGLARQLASRGFSPVPVNMSELRKAGGSAKCCTLELRERR